MIRFIPTPIGNPQDITIRAMRAFEQATLFLCEDTRHTKRLLQLLEERFELRYPSARFISFHEHNGKERLAQLADDLLEEEVVYVSDAGMPIISDPGQLLVSYCQAEGIDYDVFPGASAVTTAYAASGFEEGAFCFDGFLPHKELERRRALYQAMDRGLNTIFYEAPHRLIKLLEAICNQDPARELFLAKEMSKRYQRYYKGEALSLLNALKEQTIRGEWVVVIRGVDTKEASLSYSDILALDLPPKVKAKILAKVSDRSVKEWYELLIQ
jgi:16S rRNA (cytidine1402-2'-O)-methyltransferase